MHTGPTRAARPGWPTCTPSTRTTRTGTRPATGCGTCAGRSRRTSSSGNFALNTPDLRHVPQRPAGHRVVDEREHERQGRSVRAGDDALQRQRLLQRRRDHQQRLVRHRLQPELQRRDHHQRRGDRAVDLAAVPGHRRHQLPAEVLPACCSRPRRSCSPGSRVGSDGYLHAVANAHETQWAVQDPTTDIAADQALFSATVERRDHAEHRLLAGLPAAHRADTDRALRPHRPASAQPTARPVRGRLRHRRDRQLLPADRGHPQRARTSGWNRSGPTA